jgi:hypothetical protein
MDRKNSMRRTPLLPVISPFQNASRPIPSGVTHPIPVMTTLRGTRQRFKHGDRLMFTNGGFKGGEKNNKGPTWFRELTRTIRGVVRVNSTNPRVKPLCRTLYKISRRAPAPLCSLHRWLCLASRHTPCRTLPPVAFGCPHCGHGAPAGAACCAEPCPDCDPDCFIASLIAPAIAFPSANPAPSPMPVPAPPDGFCAASRIASAAWN